MSTQVGLAVLRARKVSHATRSRLGRRALRRGVAPSIEHAEVEFLDAPRTVLDVGANRGQFALFALQRWPDAAIHSFEPLPDAADTLERLVGDQRHVRIHRTALGPQPGSATLHVTAADDSSSLLAVADRQVELFPGTEEVGLVDVPVQRLDEVFAPKEIARPALLKIDVQGFELGVLEGAAGILADIDQVFVECSFEQLYVDQPLAHEVVDYLSDHGFAVHRVYADPSSGRRLPQADFLFVRS